MQSITLERSTSRDFALVLLASMLICVSGHVAIPLWFTPVPLALQNSSVLLMAALLGARRGAAATFFFLAQGALGMPVFSTGAGGFGTFLGPTGGYLMGYLIAAFVVGYIAEKRKSIASAVAALTVGNLIIYFCGGMFLSHFVGFSNVFTLGIAPFLAGDLIKALLSLKILQWAGWSRN